MEIDRRTIVATTVITVLFVAVLMSVYYLVRLSGPASRSPETPVRPEIKQEPVVVIPSDEGGIVEEPSVQPEPEVPEETGEPATAGKPYGPEVPPPPVLVHPLTSQGLRRVEFNPPLGDIYHVSQHDESGSLLMAVIEPDGLRSVWRLTSDLKKERVLTLNRLPGEVFLGSDSRNVHYVSVSSTGRLYRSADGGDTWQEVADSIDGAFWAIADDGQGTLWGSLHAYNRAILYRSTDDGTSWSEWKDFHRIYPEFAVTYRDGDDRFSLRHLHDVAYHNGRLFVGTGDVTRPTLMSEDGGETWREVWSEGFTAHVPLADGSGLLFGPDRLQAHGVALFDHTAGRVEEVWSPIPYGWSGYAYSMADIDGMYFAAFHTETNEVTEFSGKTGIIVSPDGRRWFPFLELGAVTHWARSDIYMERRDRWSGWVTLNGALYVFEVPVGRWFDVHRAFGE